jgi:hypothetical protein
MFRGVRIVGKEKAVTKRCGRWLGREAAGGWAMATLTLFLVPATNSGTCRPLARV